MKHGGDPTTHHTPMTTSTPNLHTVGSALPVRTGAACGGIGGPTSLCTILPPAEPTLDESPCWHFLSDLIDDYAAEHELDHFHALSQAAGLPYTVQHLPVVPESERDYDDEDDWLTHPSLTAAQRNLR